jgi:hypothetical protein
VSVRVAGPEALLVIGATQLSLPTPQVPGTAAKTFCVRLKTPIVAIENNMYLVIFIWVIAFKINWLFAMNPIIGWTWSLTFGGSVHEGGFQFPALLTAIGRKQTLSHIHKR